VFDDASFGYRRGRSTKDALRKVWKELQDGNEWIVDADLRDFFGSVRVALLIIRSTNYSLPLYHAWNRVDNHPAPRSSWSRRLLWGYAVPVASTRRWLLRFSDHGLLGLGGGVAAALALCLFGSPDTASAIGPIGEFQVNTYTTGNQERPSVASDSTGNFVVVWQSYRSPPNGSSVQGERYNASGAAVGGEFQVNTYTTGYQLDSSVASDANGNFVVVWASNGSAGTDTSSYSIQGQRYNASGSPVGAQFQVNTYTTNEQRSPSVASDANGNFVVAWQSYGSASPAFGRSIQAQRYNASGAAAGAQFQVNTYTSSNQWVPSVASDSAGNFVVVWQSFGGPGTDTSSYSIQGQRYNASGAAVGAQFQVNTYTTGNQEHSWVASDANGNFTVVWQSNGSAGTDTSSYSIQGQRYNASGVAVGGQFQVNTTTAGSQYLPRVVTDDVGSVGDFVVVWTSATSHFSDTSGTSVQGQRYNGNGAPISGEFQVNTYTTNNQRNPSVASDAMGKFVVVWDSNGSPGNDTSGYSIQGQRYSLSATGTYYSLAPSSGEQFRIGDEQPLPIWSGNPTGTMAMFPPLLIPPNTKLSEALIKQTLGVDPKQITIPPGVFRRKAPGKKVIGVVHGNPKLFQVRTNASFSAPGLAFGAAVLKAGGRTGAATATFAGPVTTIATPMMGPLRIRYGKTAAQFGGPAQASVVPVTPTRVWLRNPNGKLPCKNPAFGGTNPSCVAILAQPIPGKLAAFGAKVGFTTKTAPGIPMSPGQVIASVPNTTGLIAKSAPASGPGVTNMATSFGFPWTTGRITISAPAALGGAEKFTITGKDSRVDGQGTISLVAGALSNRKLSGPNANLGWMRLTLPEPGAALGAAAALAVLAICHALVGRRSALRRLPRRDLHPLEKRSEKQTAHSLPERRLLFRHGAPPQ